MGAMLPRFTWIPHSLIMSILLSEAAIIDADAAYPQTSIEKLWRPGHWSAFLQRILDGNGGLHQKHFHRAGHSAYCCVLDGA